MATYVGFCREDFLMHYTCGGKNPRLKFQIILTCTHLGIFSMLKSMISNNTNGEQIHIGGWYDIDMEHVMVSKLSGEIPTDLGRYNIVYMSKLPYLELMNDDDDTSSSPFMLSHTTPKCPMTSSCIACRDTIRDSVHSCMKLDLSNNDDVFACRSFERYFDLTLGEEVFVSGNNLTFDEKMKITSFIMSILLLP